MRPLDSSAGDAIDRIDLDLDFAQLDELLDDTRPLIVNTAAYTDVDGAETDRETAFQLNEKRRSN